MELTPAGFLESTGYAVSDYLDPLTDGEEGPSAWRAILSLLRVLWDRSLRQVTLHNIRRDSPLRIWLPELAEREGFVCAQSICGTVARIRLPGSWDEYLDSLASHERKELRRKVRKAVEQARAKLVIHDQRHPPDSDVLARAIALVEAASHEKRLWFQAHVRPLLRGIGSRLCIEGRMRLLTLILEGTSTACLIDFPSRDGPLLYNSGFDPAWRQWSPGVVAFALAIQDAIAEHAAFFDMLRGQETYKYRLGAIDEPLHRITLRIR